MLKQIRPVDKETSYLTKVKSQEFAFSRPNLVDVPKEAKNLVAVARLVEAKRSPLNF